VRRLLPSFRWVPVSTSEREMRSSEGHARGRIDWTMRELRERYRARSTAGTSSAGPRPARHAGHKLTPRSPARITVRRATSHADPKAAATDSRRNLAAAYATTPATPPKSCSLLGITSP
jgi:hypothetical protein